MNPNLVVIEEYLDTVSNETARGFLDRIRQISKEEAPEASEVFGYGMPGFMYRSKPLIYYAAFQKHCSLFGARPYDYKEFLAGFKISKGTIQFPLIKDLPEDLIRRIVRDRVQEIDSTK